MKIKSPAPPIPLRNLARAPSARRSCSVSALIMSSGRRRVPGGSPGEHNGWLILRRFPADRARTIPADLVRRSALHVAAKQRRFDTRYAWCGRSFDTRSYCLRAGIYSRRSRRDRLAVAARTIQGRRQAESSSGIRRFETPLRQAIVNSRLRANVPRCRSAAWDASRRYWAPLRSATDSRTLMRTRAVETVHALVPRALLLRCWRILESEGHAVEGH